ncbi:unnamed protein product, partial [marine sediment metagenome]
SVSNSDFIINLRETYYSQNVNRVLVKEATVPNVFPNIRGADYGSSQNNILKIAEAFEETVVLGEGQYAITTAAAPYNFLTALENAINAQIVGPIALSYNTLSGKIEFTNNGGVDLIIIVTSETTNSPLAAVIGVTEDLTIPSTGTPVSAQVLPDLSGFQNVYLHSKEIADSAAVDGDFGLISVITPISLSEAPYNSYAYRKNDDDELSLIAYEQPRNLRRIRIKLKDDKGNTLPVGVHNINLVLKAYLSPG